MVDPFSLLSIAAGVAAVSWVAARERRALFASRSALLDGCASVLERADITHARDGFPRLVGTWRHGRTIVTLFPDTLTPKRLPQLWLSLTRPPVVMDAPVLDILVRPTGAEAYAFNASGLERFEAPPGFPGESLIRGEGGPAARLLHDLAEPLAALLSDPRVKEITFTPRATRIIWQAAEGNRGDHLILRQATFAEASITSDDLHLLLTRAQALKERATAKRKACAA